MDVDDGGTEGKLDMIDWVVNWSFVWLNLTGYRFGKQGSRYSCR